MKETNNYYNNIIGDIYFVASRIMEDGNVMPSTNPQSKEGDGCVTDLSQSEQRIWANRPAVAIGSNDEDSVIMAFLTRKAIKEDGTRNEWYSEFSPIQVDVECTGSPATALCSHVSRVDMNNLVEWMGKATQDELTDIVDSVRKSGEFDSILPFLYQPEDSQPER